ncbi:carbohydrate ABC transporter permease [Parasedimentitalea psychrophila]|uniref:Carbohydrate ABC transporter permease n=1 Tax=Parasedimentitalea psychrophila TaxID=2997337 RepID=A0A9Y2KYE5_9RHOB|nr:carbohydrate ABC transporter permease [Parasedimentitalea psychrophila]WIY24580.1 carbohydrate ABC transporter permease [Parasedimentitalea psychrophila]
MKNKYKDLPRWAVFAIAAFVMNFPVISTLSAALKTNAEISRNPGLWVNAPTLENFAVVLEVTERLNIFSYLHNSLVASLIGSILPIMVCFPMAYAVARRGYGTNVIFPTVVNLRAMPLIIFAIPLYMMYQTVGLLDTRLGLGLILAVVNLPLALLLLINAINDVPYELDEAARMDGARIFTILVKIVFPICLPALATVFIFSFITAWNEFLFGLMLTTSEAVPMTVGASFFFSSGGGGVQWGVAAAVIIVASLPPVVLGILMYKHISRSMTAGAVKG